MPLRRITFPVLVVFFLLAGLVTGPAANAATGKANWLDHRCKTSHSHSCVQSPIDADNVGHHVTFHDNRGHHHTANTAARAWSIARKHSHRCSGPFDHGCYGVDAPTGLRVLIFHDGTYVAVKRYHR